MVRPFRFCFLALLAAALLAPASASAASNQVMTFEAPSELLDDFAREETLDEIQALGVSHVRALVYWSEFSARPNSKSKPTFNTADPNAYPADTWGRLDRLVDSLERRGMTAQLTLTGPVPKWATKTPQGQGQRPGRAAVRQVGARRRHALRRPHRPVVDLERAEPPGLPRPAVQERQPHTPKLYRKLYVAGEGAIHGVAGNAKDKVLFGETAPIGNQNVVSPLAFLRGALCLDKNYKAKGKCKKLRIDGYAHHAYTRKAGPTFVSTDADEVSIGSLGRLSAALDKAARAGRIDKNGRDIYLTEFGIQSWPDKLAGVRPARQAEYTAMSEKMAYANPRVKAFSQYLLRDDEPRKGKRPRALLRLRERPAHLQGQEEARLQRVHAPARRDAVRPERRALGPRAAGDRTDPGRDRAQDRQRQVEAADRAPDRRRLRVQDRAPQQPPLPREVDTARRLDRHGPADPGLLDG